MAEEQPTPPIDTSLEDNPDKTVRERVGDVLVGIAEPATVAEIAEMANCSKEGARTAVREFEQWGIVIQTQESPEKYRKNLQYFQFLRGHRLAQKHTQHELLAQLRELYLEHLEYVEQTGVESPNGLDEEWLHNQEGERGYELRRDWRSLLSQADDFREAYRQLSGEQLPDVTSGRLAHKLLTRMDMDLGSEGETMRAESVHTEVEDEGDEDVADNSLPFDPDALENIVEVQKDLQEQIEVLVEFTQNMQQTPTRTESETE